MSEEGPDWTLHQAELGRQFAQAGLDIKVYPVLHLGTHNLTKIMTGFVDSLRNSTGPNGTRLTIIGRSEVVGISRAGDGFSVETTRGRTRATRVVLAVGKSGAPKMRELLAEMGATDIPRPVWIGVRVDAPYESGRDLLAISFDPKISMRDRMGRVKTHCFCRHGSLLIMKHRGACLVGGHSPVTAKNVRVVPKLNEADRLSFNVLASRNFDASRVQEVFDVFARVGRDSVVVQDLGSFLRADAALADRYAHLEARVPARTADVRSLLDSFMGLGSSIADLLARLGTIYPGVIAPNNLVFAPAIEWDYGSVKVDAEMQTTIPGLYAVGDGAGISQGIVHAGATGLICAEAIARATHRPH